MGDDKQTVLIVVGNPMTETSLRSHFERRGWQVTVCDDGDKAVDEYVASKPDLVLLSLDISGLDGHIAALEIRETHFNARIAFVSTRSGKALAEDAAFSAGATAILTTPITSSDMDEVWGAMMGEMPGAPGLADLDELYPSFGAAPARQPSFGAGPTSERSEDEQLQAAIEASRQQAQEDTQLQAALAAGVASASPVK